MFSNAAERRRERRIMLRLPAILRWVDEDKREITEETFTASISNNGASFEISNKPPRAGESIEVTLDVYNQRGSSSAVVRWVEKSGYGFGLGVCFID
jgi:hypothetical protein